jgi:hypothetical protein
MMNEKVKNALTRLNSVLPLKDRQDECSLEIKALHQAVLRSFVENGRSLNRAEIAPQVNNIDEAVNILQSSDMIVFSADGEPIGAYPFTMEEREHKIQVNGYQVHAMCALDALAVSPMFGQDTEISSQCRVTGDPVHIQQSGQSIQNIAKAGDVFAGIAWGADDGSSCCADSLCMEMIFLRDDNIAQQWLTDDPANREIFTLLESVAFAAQFFVPLLD